MLGMSTVSAAAVGVGVSLAYLAALPAETGTTPPTAGFDNHGQLILAVLTILAGAFNLYMTWRKDKLASDREEMHRRWLMEDREEAAARAVRVAEKLAQKTDETANILVRRIDNNTALTREGVAAAKDAYKEANTVNEKIASIGGVRRAEARKEEPIHERETDSDRSEEESK